MTTSCSLKSWHPRPFISDANELPSAVPLLPEVSDQVWVPYYPSYFYACLGPDADVQMELVSFLASRLVELRTYVDASVRRMVIRSCCPLRNLDGTGVYRSCSGYFPWL